MDVIPDLLGRAGPALAVCLGLAALALWALRRSGAAVPFARSGGDRLCVVATRPLDVRTRLVLVRCDDREQLLAVGPTGVVLIGAPTPSPAEGV